jgi:hypothetical protein
MHGADFKRIAIPTVTFDSTSQRLAGGAITDASDIGEAFGWHEPAIPPHRQADCGIFAYHEPR